MLRGERKCGDHETGDCHEQCDRRTTATAVRRLTATTFSSAVGHAGSMPATG
jgi:hypothetical protein